MSYLVLLMVVLATGLLAAERAAAVIYLDDGDSLKGNIVTSTELEVTIEIPGLGKVTPERSEIDSIEKAPVEEAVQVLSPKPTPTLAPATTGEKIIRKVGEQESSFLIQKINPDSVEGLWYDAYPLPGPEGSSRTLHIGDDIGYACEGVSEKLTSINFYGQEVTFTKMVGPPPFGGCPICLAGNTLIDTPSGLVPIRDLQVGMPIWAIDKAGQRVSGVVTRTSKVPVLPTQKIVHLVFDDGRELSVSPGHLTIDGRRVDDLTQGDLYDGATVVSAQSVPYDESATYDVLPSGETGFYWANGVLLGSTLSRNSGNSRRFQNPSTGNLKTDVGSIRNSDGK